MIYYSKSTYGFYDSSIHGSRTIEVPDPQWVAPMDAPNATAPLVEIQNAACLIPTDAVEIPDELRRALLIAESAGATITFDEVSQLPVARVILPSLIAMRDSVFTEARAFREVVLNRLAGIGMRALVANDTVSALASSDLQQKLLDITKHPAVLAVTAEQGADVLRQTILGIYRSYALAAPLNIRAAFNEVDQ